MRNAIVLAFTFVCLIGAFNSASADIVKTGSNIFMVHGCATDRAAKRIDKFIKKDPTFFFDNKNHTASLTITEPTQDGTGVVERKWSSGDKKVKVTWIDINKADFILPLDEDTHTQTHILVDASPFASPTVQTPSIKSELNEMTRAKPRINVQIINDYLPGSTEPGTKQKFTTDLPGFESSSRCYETWNGTAVWL